MQKKKKVTPKKRVRAKKSDSKILKYILVLLLVLLFLVGAFIGGYYYGYENSQNDIAKQEKIKNKKCLDILKKQDKVVKHKDVNNRLKEILKKEQKYEVSGNHEFKDESLVNLTPEPEIVKKVAGKKPKLVIIMDDVSVRSQVNAIKALNIPITMSFFPPKPSRPNSAKLASQQSVYMVHLPMEAMHFSKNEPNTLKTTDSSEKISNRMDYIVKTFPRVKFLNNHTGSKFTANASAMNKLIYAFNKRGLTFVDSRTTAKTKAPEVLKEYGLKYIARDVFLDHKMDEKYVEGQIKLAVEHAKKYGYTIAIGHPHANTLMAIHKSKKLFKDVDLVYINQL